MSRSKYKELYLEEKYKKEHYQECIDTIIKRLKELNIITTDIQPYPGYRGIEIKKRNKSEQFMFMWEEINENK